MKTPPSATAPGLGAKHSIRFANSPLLQSIYILKIKLNRHDSYNRHCSDRDLGVGANSSWPAERRRGDVPFLLLLFYNFNGLRISVSFNELLKL
jgi:hypothetical protein